MTISKTSIRYRLYKSFGIVLFMVLLVFIVNYIAVRREQGTNSDYKQAMTLDEATNKIRFQIAQNSLYLGNYLLSGDTREVERMNEGSRKLADSLQTATTLAGSEKQKDDFNHVLSLQLNWSRD